MTDLPAKLREVLPCLWERACWKSKRPPCAACVERAKVEAVVQEMLAKVPHLAEWYQHYSGNRWIDPVVGVVSPEEDDLHRSPECTRFGGQCAFGGEKGTNNG